MSNRDRSWWESFDCFWSYLGSSVYWDRFCEYSALYDCKPGACTCAR